MNAELIQREYTPEELLAMPGGKNFELVKGRLVERHGGISRVSDASQKRLYGNASPKRR